MLPTDRFQPTGEIDVISFGLPHDKTKIKKNKGNLYSLYFINIDTRKKLAMLRV